MTLVLAFTVVGVTVAGETPARQAETLYRQKKYRQSLPLWQKLAKGRDAGRDTALYRLWEIPLREVSSPAEARRTIKTLRENAVSHSREFVRAAGCVLLAEFTPGEPALPGLFADLQKSKEPRVALAAFYGDAIRLRQQKKLKPSLERMRRALELYRQLATSPYPDSTGKKEEIDPGLPWNREDIARQIKELETAIRDQDDGKLHAEALVLYANGNFSAARALFQKILADFPESRFTESAVFHCAACDLRAPSAGKKEKTRKELEAPLFAYMGKYPQQAQAPDAAPGRFHARAWFLLGESRCLDPQVKDEPVLETWEKSRESAGLAPEKEELPDEFLPRLLFRLAGLHFANGKFAEAKTYLEAMRGCRMSEITAEGVRRLLYECARNEEIIPHLQKVFVKATPADRRALLLLAVTNELDLPECGKKFAFFLRQPETLKRLTPEFMAARAYYLANFDNVFSENSGENNPDVTGDLRKAIDKYPQAAFVTDNYHLLCLFYALSGHGDESQATAEEFLRKFPRKGKIHEWMLLQLAFIHYSNGRKEKYAPLYHLYLKMYPEKSKQCEKIRKRVME